MATMRASIRLRPQRAFVRLLWSLGMHPQEPWAVLLLAAASDAPQPSSPPSLPAVQLEWRMSMLCEQSGFINEALDFLVSLERWMPPRPPPPSSSSSTSSHLPVLFNISSRGCTETERPGTHHEPGPRRGAAAPAGR